MFQYKKVWTEKAHLYVQHKWQKQTHGKANQHKMSELKSIKKRFYRLPQADFIQRIRIKKASNCLMTTLKEGNRAMPSNSEGKVLQT